MKRYSERLSQLPPPKIVVSGSMQCLPPAISLVDISRHAWRCTDSTGIPLSSDRADPTIVAGIDWEYQPFPFAESPSRFLSPRPMSGLEKRRFLAHHLALFSVMEALRAMYIDQVLKIDPLSGRSKLTLQEAEALHRALIYLPHYLTHRTRDMIPNQGVLPPSIIILSNGCGGALGAMNSYIVDQEKDQGEGVMRTSPAGGLLVQNAEDHKSMVGDKTVCPIAPRQQGAFIEALLQGVSIPHYPNQQADEALEWLNKHFHPIEISALTLFSEQLYQAQGLVDGQLKKYDGEAFSQISPHLKHNPRRYRDVLAGFLFKSGELLNELNKHQVGVNFALGRSPQAKGLTLESFEPIPTNLKMPALLRSILARDRQFFDMVSRQAATHR